MFLTPLTHLLRLVIIGRTIGELNGDDRTEVPFSFRFELQPVLRNPEIQPVTGVVRWSASKGTGLKDSSEKTRKKTPVVGEIYLQVVFEKIEKASRS